MTHREKIIAVLNGEKLDVIPLYNECPMDITVFRDIMPKRTGNDIHDTIQHIEFFGNSATGGQGIGLHAETISKDENHHTYRYETGAVWHESYKPTFCREATEFHINTPAEALSYKMPDANAPERFDAEAMTKRVQTLQDGGYFVEGVVQGAWMGIYYYLTSFDNILLWMALEPDAAQALFDMMRKFSVDSTKRLLTCGVDCIFAPSDLGSGQGLLFSEPMFRQYVFPWLKEMSDLCHEHGAYFHLHSHGHIEDLMDGIVESGVDFINPIGPGDNNDLKMFKDKWGEKITLHGGISTTIASMPDEEIRKHVKDVISVGRVGGRFFPRSESGIPPMPVEKLKVYLDALHKECANGYK